MSATRKKYKRKTNNTIIPTQTNNTDTEQTPKIIKTDESTKTDNIPQQNPVSDPKPNKSTITDNNTQPEVAVPETVETTNLANQEITEQSTATIATPTKEAEAPNSLILPTPPAQLASPNNIIVATPVTDLKRTPSPEVTTIQTNHTNTEQTPKIIKTDQTSNDETPKTDNITQPDVATSDDSSDDDNKIINANEQKAITHFSFLSDNNSDNEIDNDDALNNGANYILNDLDEDISTVGLPTTNRNNVIPSILPYTRKDSDAESVSLTPVLATPIYDLQPEENIHAFLEYCNEFDYSEDNNVPLTVETKLAKTSFINIFIQEVKKLSLADLEYLGRVWLAAIKGKNNDNPFLITKIETNPIALLWGGVGNTTSYAKVVFAFKETLFTSLSRSEYFANGKIILPQEKYDLYCQFFAIQRHHIPNFFSAPSWVTHFKKYAQVQQVQQSHQPPLPL